MTRFEMTMNEMERVAATAQPAEAARIRATIAGRRQAEEQRARQMASRTEQATARRLKAKAALAAINRELQGLEQETMAAVKAGREDGVAAMARAKRSAELFRETERLRAEFQKGEAAARQEAAAADAAWMTQATRWAAEDAGVLHGR